MRGRGQSLVIMDLVPRRELLRARRDGRGWAALCVRVCVLLLEPPPGDGRPAAAGRGAAPLESLDPDAIRFSHARIYETFSCGRCAPAGVNSPPPGPPACARTRPHAPARARTRPHAPARARTRGTRARPRACAGLTAPSSILDSRSVRQTLRDIEAGSLAVEQLPTITVVDTGQGCAADGRREMVSLNNRCHAAQRWTRTASFPARPRAAPAPVRGEDAQPRATCRRLWVMKECKARGLIRSCPLPVPRSLSCHRAPVHSRPVGLTPHARKSSSSVPCRVVGIGASRRERRMYQDPSQFSFTAVILPGRRERSERSAEAAGAAGTGGGVGSGRKGGGVAGEESIGGDSDVGGQGEVGRGAAVGTPRERREGGGDGGGCDGEGGDP